MIVAFGHSLLAMSGFETLAQVYRELAYPKLKNLRITANIDLHLRGGQHRVHLHSGGDDHSGCRRGHRSTTT